MLCLFIFIVELQVSFQLLPNVCAIVKLIIIVMIFPIIFTNNEIEFKAVLAYNYEPSPGATRYSLVE